MPKEFDVRVCGVSLHFLPLHMRVPLKFGPETVTSVTCARVGLRVRDDRGRIAEGWGETPLSVSWVWPSALTYEARQRALMSFSEQLAENWSQWDRSGHPIEIGCAFIEERLPALLEEFNAAMGSAGMAGEGRPGEGEGGNIPPALPEPMPWLAALVCCSAFDLALHDAYGILHQVPVYETYQARYMNCDLAAYLHPADGANLSFAGRFPSDYLIAPRANSLPAWHLVGGKDLLGADELTGSEPNDGYPVLLDDWISRDGLWCLKIKLRGNDLAWDYRRIVEVGQMAVAREVRWLTTDFNCTVTDPAYVNEILDRMIVEHPRLYGMILYVEQPFPYDLEKNQIDVHGVSGRKPLFMDESAHDWRHIRLGRTLGWSGVALKTCKTQTGALLSLCWAKAHGMTLMVQDLTNPMLAQIPHVLLAAHAGTIMGVETNSMQFYPEASRPEARVHPGVFQRRQGTVDLRTIQGPGFGYDVAKIERTLPPAVVTFG